MCYVIIEYEKSCMRWSCENRKIAIWTIVPFPSLCPVRKEKQVGGEMPELNLTRRRTDCTKSVSMFVSVFFTIISIFSHCLDLLSITTRLIIKKNYFLYPPDWHSEWFIDVFVIVREIQCVLSNSWSSILSKLFSGLVLSYFKVYLFIYIFVQWYKTVN